MLPFVSCNKKDNVQVIHVNISSCVQGHVFAQITFEKCIKDFYFENCQAVIKTTIDKF